MAEAQTSAGSCAKMLLVVRVKKIKRSTDLCIVESSKAGLEPCIVYVFRRKVVFVIHSIVKKIMRIMPPVHYWRFRIIFS
jgi:hypothetical protein